MPPRSAPIVCGSVGFRSTTCSSAVAATCVALRGDRTRPYHRQARVIPYGRAEGEHRVGDSPFPHVDPRLDVRGARRRCRHGPVTLAGTLVLPRTGSSVPAVVFLHGSGAGPVGVTLSRGSARVAARGVDLRQRGVGGSTGDWRRAALEDLAADGAAAVARLRSEPRIDARRIGCMAIARVARLRRSSRRALPVLPSSSVPPLKR